MVRIFSIIALSAACILAVSARPAKHSPKPFSLPVRKRSHGTFKQTVAGDHKRLTRLSSKGNNPPPITATNDYTFYTIPVSVGTPATTIEMAFDTSTPFTIIPYFNTTASSTCMNLGETISPLSDVDSAYVVLYGDQMSLGPYNFQQAFGVGFFSNGINVMGFGPSTDDSSRDLSNHHVPSVMDNLVANNMVPSNVVGIDFRPIWNSSISAVNGEIDIGFINTYKYSGNIAYTPLVTVPGFGSDWIFNIPSIQFGGNTVYTDVTALLDAGVAMMWVSPYIINALFGSIHGGQVDPVTSLFTIPTSKVHLLKPISFTIGGSTITWAPSQYMITAQQAALQGLTGNVHYLNIGQNQMQGFAMAVGVSFIEDFYTVLDLTNQQIGFATRK